MKILIIGAGGREHALAWKLKQSPEVTEIFTAPGNPGTALLGKNIDIQVDDIDGLKAFALENDIGLTVVGPELPLTLGIVDSFAAAGLKAFGPSKAAAELEGSKAFSKEIMERYSIPTAAYKEFTDAALAKSYIQECARPLVVKADGLAAGKGVILCQTTKEAEDAVLLIMKDKAFGEAGTKIIVEDFLAGEEASFLAICDGSTALPLAPAQDHKAIFEGDTGPNTGGMGAYTPTPALDKALQTRVMDAIIHPMLQAMTKEGRPYKGVLYAGLMIHDSEIKVLEFNCRFGDPEAQPILMRLKSDLLPILLASVDGTLNTIEAEWDERTAVCVVISSKGYPGSYQKGDAISGLDDANSIDDVVVFHAGTSEQGGKVITSGGRVLGVTGLGAGIKEAINNTYKAVNLIKFDGAYHRRDIGKKAIR
jgi:phosphoribosylamine--glycine ligase